MGEDDIATRLRAASQQRNKRPSVGAVQIVETHSVQNRRRQVDSRDHVLGVGHTGADDTGPAHDPGRTCRLHPDVRLGERQRGAMIGQEHHQGALGHPRVVERPQDGAHGGVGALHRGVVLRHLPPNVGQIRQETRHRNLRRRKSQFDIGKAAAILLARAGSIARLGVDFLPAGGERPVRVLRVGHQEERPARILGLPKELRRVLVVKLRAATVLQILGRDHHVERFDPTGDDMSQLLLL